MSIQSNYSSNHDSMWEGSQLLFFYLIYYNYVKKRYCLFNQIKDISETILNYGPLMLSSHDLFLQLLRTFVCAVYLSSLQDLPFAHPATFTVWFWSVLAGLEDVSPKMYVSQPPGVSYWLLIKNPKLNLGHDSSSSTSSWVRGQCRETGLLESCPDGQRRGVLTSSISQSHSKDFHNALFNNSYNAFKAFWNEEIGGLIGIHEKTAVLTDKPVFQSFMEERKKSLMQREVFLTLCTGEP